MILINGEEVVFEKFPNNELRLVYDNLTDLDETGYISFKYEDDSDLIKLYMLAHYLDENYTNFTDDYQLIIYYMPYSRMDRSENESPFTLRYVSKLINSLNFGEVYIVEPHSNVTPALVDNSKSLYVNEVLVKEVIEILGLDMNSDYIMYPDTGASSRYKSFTYPNVIIGNKQRDFSTGEIKGLQLISDFETDCKRVLIVDDLSSYGGTFVHSAKKLREQGFEEVYLLVAHAENSIFKGELFNHVDKVFTTDSILTEQGNWENKKFESQLQVFKIEDVIKPYEEV